MPNKKVPLPWTTVIATSTTSIFWPATGYMPTTGMRQFRAQMEISHTDKMEIAPAYQAVDAIDDGGGGVSATDIKPGKKTSPGFYFANEGYTDPTGTVKGKALVRFGWNVNLTTAGDPVDARVSGAIQIVLK